MDEERLAEHWRKQPTASEADLASRRPVPVGSPLLDRADTALRRAAELNVDWFWLRRALWDQRAARLSSAVERLALAAHRAGLLWLPPADRG